MWRPIETAPAEGMFLAYWPACRLDDAGNLTEETAGPGYIGAAEKDSNGSVCEPDALNAVGAWQDDDWEYGNATHWMPLPLPPNTRNQASEPR